MRRKYPQARLTSVSFIIVCLSIYLPICFFLVEMFNLYSIQYMPCNHILCCHSCSKITKRCPTCRTVITLKAPYHGAPARKNSVRNNSKDSVGKEASDRTQISFSNEIRSKNQDTALKSLQAKYDVSNHIYRVLAKILGLAVFTQVVKTTNPKMSLCENRQFGKTANLSEHIDPRLAVFTATIFTV